MKQILLTMFLLVIFTVVNTFGQNNTSITKDIETDKVVIKPQKTAFDANYDSIYQWRVSQSHLDDVYIPMDINDCFKQLDKLMEEPVKKRFMAFSDEEVDSKTHASLGKWIDHKWQITQGSRISNYFKRMGVPHPEYTIGIILTSYHRYLHKKELKLKEQVTYFKEKWNEKQREKAKELIGN
jgi:hypothetical protein